VNRVIAVILALLGAVHVSIPAVGMAAPVPVILAFTAVIVTLLWMIWGAAFGSRMHWSAGA